MAPFAREKPSGHAFRSRKPRNTLRGGLVRSGRGGTKNRKTLSASTPRNPFHSTRVEESVQEQGDDAQQEAEQQSGSPDGQPAEASKLSGDSDNESDGEVLQRSARPYNSLLQSLTADGQKNEPQRKRRKVEHPEDLVERETVEEATYDVEEPETVKEVEVEGDGDDLDVVEESQDSFIRHFSAWDDHILNQSIQDLRTGSSKHIVLGKPEAWSISYEGPSKQLGLPPFEGGKDSFIGVEDFYVKRKLKDPAQRLFQRLDDVEANIAATVFNYTDVLFPQRTLDNADILRNILCLHSLNHVLKTRDKVIKNNDRLARQDAGEELELRDQGFTRPKVLIILPTRHSCLKYIDIITSSWSPEQQENKKRFQDAFAASEDNVSLNKPADFQDLFAGNDDDMFRLGLKFTRKTIKFFSPFYSSDIIIASPLGLRMAIGGDDPKKQDHDFLSSIEIVVMDQADATAMQNWDHIEYIFERLNLQPKEAHDCDFSRVRHWYLDNQAKYLRQTILLSAFNFPALNRIYTKSLMNVAGKIKYHKKFGGAILDIGLPLKQTFSRFSCKSPASEPDDRFKYFSTAIVPSLAKFHLESRKGILILIPSYADFVRVRNYFASSPDAQNISFGSISEYTSVREVARARSHFLSGRHSVLLYTERAHHFHRYHLKGVKKVIMYALPDNPIFYTEIVGGFLQSSITATEISAREVSARALFSRLDILKLERIVGSSRYVSMAMDKTGDTFVFE